LRDPDWHARRVIGRTARVGSRVDWLCKHGNLICRELRGDVARQRCYRRIRRDTDVVLEPANERLIRLEYADPRAVSAWRSNRIQQTKRCLGRRGF